MKLKKLFLAKIRKPSIILTVSLFAALVFTAGLSSCNSTSRLIPGMEEQKNLDLYNQYMIIADEYFSQKKYDKAKTYYTECLNCEDLYWDAYYKLAKISVLQSDWNSAEEKFKTLLKRDPENSTLKENLAYVYAQKGNKDEAVKIYLELIETSGAKSSFYENLITIYISQKKVSDAEKYLDLLKEKFPDTQSIQKFQSAIDALKESMENKENKN